MAARAAPPARGLQVPGPAVAGSVGVCATSVARSPPGRHRSTESHRIVFPQVSLAVINAEYFILALLKHVVFKTKMESSTHVLTKGS